MFLTACLCISVHQVSAIRAVATINLEHAAEIAATEKEQEKAMRAKDRKMAANEKKLGKKHAAAAKAHGKEVPALQKALEVSANNMITLSYTKFYSPLTLL